MSATCEHCSKKFVPTQNSRARFCSRTCSGKASRGVPRTIKTPNCTCFHCGIAFYRCKSKQVSKSGLLFCGRKCKEQTQLDPAHGISPPHYGNGNGEHSYRQRALRLYAPICVVCGYEKHSSVLEVHHRDKNRSNNDLSNLAVVCPTCHTEIHKGLLELNAHKPNSPGSVLG